ncbi:MAG: 2-C-methyl-D-erythritol 2,4-cyclodiphosphate synthase [Firmicutes bacterium ADurb.Bin193]|nr:MAG: 2-C-methyl-D-erythritol 2,4-cyclodiphosphate synthase [Firmicutes bacterium ADurb.Bin193]
MRVGIGYDVHRLVEGRKLVLGGVCIPYPLGLLGHSDADVVIHAVMDALLGAAGLGDIGAFFPDNDPQYKDIESTILLKRVNEIIKEKGYTVSNVDSVVVAQAPKLAPHIGEMRKNIAKILELGDDFVCVKATTTENLGFEGRKEGISAHAVCIIE